MGMRQSRADASEAFRSVPVLVLGVGITALGAIRCLGRRGIRLFVAGTHEDLVTRSRWYRPLPGGPLPATAAALAERLATVSEERMVLLPCTDAWAVAVSGLAPELARRFPSSQARPEVMERLIDKGRFAETLEEIGTPHPKTVVLRNETSLDAVPDDFLRVSFLKPSRTRPFSEKYRAKAIRFRDRQDVRRHFDQTRGMAFDLMLQEFIPGPATCHFFVEGFVDRRRKFSALFARQRIRMYPTEFGNSTATRSIPTDRIPQAADSIRNLLNRIEYRGVFSAEFKYDVRDRLFKILEVNARPWWFVEFAAACGVDVCSMARLDALEEDVEPVLEYSNYRQCVYPRLDTRSGNGSRLWKLARSWIGADHLTLSTDDPAPGLHELFRWGSANLRHRLPW